MPVKSPPRKLSRAGLTKAEVSKQFRHNVKGRFCLCGNPAIACKSGSFICDRCNKIENTVTYRAVRNGSGL